MECSRTFQTLDLDSICFSEMTREAKLVSFEKRKKKKKNHTCPFVMQQGTASVVHDKPTASSKKFEVADISNGPSSLQGNNFRNVSVLGFGSCEL